MKAPLNKISDSLKRHYDVIIASVSYEERCLSIIKAIDSKIEFTQKIVSVSTPHKCLFPDNIEIFNQNGYTPIEINNSKQIDTVNNFMLKISEILASTPNASFLIDITTFTKQTLLILLRLLRNSLTKENQIQFLYTPAKEYAIGLTNEEKWLSRGILKVNSVFGYSGIIRPSRPFHLVLLMGFEVERASSLINAYEPSKISVGYARKEGSISEELYQLNRQKFNELLMEFPNAESFEFSCTDIDECKLNILAQTAKYEDCNVIVSPMNNKISTISCSLAAFENDEIQLAIAIPALYNYQSYSIPSDYYYLFDIPEFIK